MVAHETYVEPFAGGAMVFFAKPPVPREVLNDIDPQVVNVYRVVQEYPLVLGERLSSLNYLVRNEFKGRWEGQAPLDAAVYFLAHHYTRYNGGASASFSLLKAREASRRDFISIMRRAVQRLHGVTITNQDALDCIAATDSQGTLFYCDPPYIEQRQDYRYGYSLAQTKDLEACLRSIQGKVIVSLEWTEVAGQIFSPDRWCRIPLHHTHSCYELLPGPERKQKPSQKFGNEVILMNYEPPVLVR
jgi:DNA adenine methylase